MKKFKQLAERFARDERGVTAIEYSLIAAVISVAALTAFQAVGTQVNAKMTAVSDALK